MDYPALLNGALLESWAATLDVAFILEWRPTGRATGRPTRESGGHRQRVALTTGRADVDERRNSGGRLESAGPGQRTIRRGSGRRLDSAAAPPSEWPAAELAGPTGSQLD